MIGDRIKELRENRGLTQKQLSEDPRLDLNINTLASYERNLREPKIDMIIRLARYFGVTTDYLLGMSEHKTAENEAISKIVPLSDAALDFIKACPAELLHTLNGFLVDKNAAVFLQELAAYVYSLNSGVASDVAEILAARFMENGTSKTAPERVRMLAANLTPAIQQASLINALNAVAESMNEKESSSSGTGEDGGK